MRVAIKIIADFTGMLQARHPYELGGAYWLFNMIYTQASVFVVLAVRAKRDVDDDKLAFQQNDLWLIAGILLGLWILAIIMLLYFSEEGFQHTFYQRLTGFEFSKQRFISGNDEIRMSVFDDHESYYLRYKGEIIEWLQNIWDKLHAEKPAWFTEDVRRRIPEEFIPHLGENGVKDEIGGEAMEDMKREREPHIVKTLSRHLSSLVAAENGGVGAQRGEEG